MKGFSTNLKRAASLLLSVLMLLNASGLVSAKTANLAAKMYWTTDAETGVWADASSATAGTVFDCADFEPGSEAIRYIKVENAGKRALSYALSLASDAEISDLANVLDVYKADNVSANTTIDQMTLVGTLAEVINGLAFSDGDILPGSLADEGFYSGSTVVALALKMKSDASADYMNKAVDAFSINLSAMECEYDNYPSVDKFEVVFPNTDKYIYRVGNLNAVKLGSLFSEIEGAEIGNVTVSIEKLDAVTDVSGTYTPAANWKDATIQFTGTGPVRVTIDDDDFANAVSLNLEVITATNLTSAASVTTNDAVLLNDVTFSTITVSGGHTLYGNGFKLHAPNDVASAYIYESFVDLQNGTLDNVKVVCPNFSYQTLYHSNLKSSDNIELYDSHYANARNGVKMTGKSKIVNSYVSGGRAAVYAPSNYPVIENSTIYGGAVANIFVGAVSNILLKDITLIQEPVKATVHDSDKTIMGMSVFVDSNADTPIITLEGGFVQYAWAHEGYAGYVPQVGDTLGINPVTTALSYAQFKHAITYSDGKVGDPSINLGFICGASKNIGSMITDNRTNKATVPYTAQSVSVASVYSYNNSNGLDASFATIPEYASKGSALIPATLTYQETGLGMTFTNGYDDDKGMTSTLTVDLDTLDTFTFSFDKLIAEKFGRSLPYTVKNSSGNTVTDKTITLSDTGIQEYSIEITDNLHYDANGAISGKEETYTHYLVIAATKTSINPPVNKTTTYENNPLVVVDSKDGDWTAAIPASLSTITVNYYSTKDKAYKDLNLSSIAPQSAGKQNNTNNFWEYTGEDFKFKVSCGVIHNSVSGMPVVVTKNNEKKLYFVVSTNNGSYVSTKTTARTVTLTYEFTDGNGNTISWTNTWVAYRADILNGTQGDDKKQYKYSEFVKGNLTEAESCLAEGTLITLADGTQKAIEDLTFEDKILVWDFSKGEYVASVPTLLINDGEADYDVITLNFDDGTSVRTIYEHGFFDVAENDFVLINADNVADYVGHSFIKYNGSENEVVTLESYEITKETIGCYTILTAFHNNCIANGMLSVTPPPIDGWYDYFEIGEGMKYDEAAMKADIETYGLYTYDDFEDYITYEEFLAFNGPYLKILVGKGYFTFEDILEQIAIFGVGNAVAALSMGEEITITLAGNKVSSAGYAISASVEGATESEGVYTLTGNDGVVTLTAQGTASTGYATISVDGDTYCTAQLAPGESLAINIANVKNAKDKALTVAYNWGASSADAVLENGGVIDFGEFTIKSIDGASVTLSNTTKYPVTSDIYLAVYGNDYCTFVAMDGNKTIEGKDEYTFAPEYELPENATVKAFIWEVGTMKPILLTK